jgi:hypothetical protein
MSCPGPRPISDDVDGRILRHSGTLSIFRTAYASRRSKPNRGRRVRYTNPHRWTPGFRLVSPDKAVAMIIMHYLSAYGPATPQQFAQWIDAPPSWAAEQFELHSRRLAKINFNERIGEILEGKPPAQRRDRHGRRHA